MHDIFNRKSMPVFALVIVTTAIFVNYLNSKNISILPNVDVVDTSKKLDYTSQNFSNFIADVKNEQPVCTENRMNSGVKLQTVNLLDDARKALFRIGNKIIDKVLKLLKVLGLIVTDTDKTSPSDVVVGVLPAELNDHLPNEVFTQRMSVSQKSLVQLAYDHVVRDVDVVEAAKLTHWSITPHLMYRYYSSSDWSSKYYGRSVAEAVTDTILWRKSMGVHSLHTEDLHSLVEKGLLYTKRLDRRGRPIVYLKPGIEHKKETADTYLRLLVHTIEKADRMSVESGAGEMIAVLDLFGYRFNKGPPLGVIKDGLNMLKLHYPYRLGAIYLLNAGTAFSFLWSVLQPLLSQRTKSKIFVLKHGDIANVLPAHLGEGNVETPYGGLLQENIVAMEYFD